MQPLARYKAHLARWDSDYHQLGNGLQVGFVAVCMAAIAVLLALSKPLVQTTIQAFPDAQNGKSGYAALEVDVLRGLVD